MAAASPDLLTSMGRAALVLTLVACGGTPMSAHATFGAVHPATAIERIAIDYQTLANSGDDASGFPDRSRGALARRQVQEDRLADALAAAPADSSPLRAALQWRLETDRALRSCRGELWDVDHINGWQVILPERLASLHPLSAAAKASALARAVAIGAHVDVDIDNLKRGLASGYAAPRTVVHRVLGEIDALMALPPARSPILQPATTSDDSDFAARWRAAVAFSIKPAYGHYRSFLAKQYLSHARRSVGLSGLPSGAACYAANLRRATTLSWTPNDVFQLGVATVAQAQQELSMIGQRRYGVSDPAAVLTRAKADKTNRFSSQSALLAFSTSALRRTVAMSAPLFVQVPSQAIVAERLPDFQDRAGVPSHYEAQSDPNKAAVYKISLKDWANETVGAAEVTASHESEPGHHLQIATARQLGADGRFADIGYNTAYVEGWANYAERLAEESGIYTSDSARIFRRAVLGRSLVVDPGVHVFGWSRKRAVDYLRRAGLGRQAAEDTLDRVAVQPAQFTSYESGGLEIWRLREAARTRLGSRFSLPRFHKRVLERGVVTLADLKTYVEAWTGE